MIFLVYDFKVERAVSCIARQVAAGGRQNKTCGFGGTIVGGVVGAAIGALVGVGTALIGGRKIAKFTDSMGKQISKFWDWLTGWVSNTWKWAISPFTGETPTTTQYGMQASYNPSQQGMNILSFAFFNELQRKLLDFMQKTARAARENLYIFQWISNENSWILYKNRRAQREKSFAFFMPKSPIINQFRRRKSSSGEN